MRVGLHAVAIFTSSLVLGAFVAHVANTYPILSRFNHPASGDPLVEWTTLNALASLMIVAAGIGAGVGILIRGSIQGSSPFLLVFRDATGEVHLHSAPWFWALAFSWVYLLVKRMWVLGFIALAAALALDLNVAIGLLLMQFANGAVRWHARRRGEVEVLTAG